MKDRNYAIDFLKTVAIIAVVAIHVSTAYLDRAQTLSLPFDVMLVINGFTRFAVPLFFLASGLLLGTRYLSVSNVGAFYKRRIFRIIPPYLFWTLAYYFLFIKDFPQSLFKLSFIYNLLTGNTSYQFYFIPTICVLYLLFPLFIRYKNVLLSKQFVLLFFIIECILLYFVYYNTYQIPLYSPLRNALINLSPFLIGIFLSKHYDRTKRFLTDNFYLSIIIAAVTGTIIVAESALLFVGSKDIIFLRNQWRPSVLTYALSCGAMLYVLYERFLNKYNRVILWFSTYSFGVFFIHVALMYPLLIIIDTYRLYGLISFILFFTVTISTSYILIYVSSKLPKIGRIVSAS